DPLKWWKAHENLYPTIAALAKIYLAIPASSASSERVFSTAGNIVTAKRNCLSTENVNLLIFLNKNKSL
ncbi:Zinc finger BED domain-containing protein 1, partial [Harpegnathos saltator]